MTIKDVEMLFKFVGGLGMFLYGMNMMGNCLQKSAGGKMKQLLGVLTNNKFLAVLVGVLVTAIIQSSSATTVMVVGFVNAGLMSLTQAVGVIMGANVGTTVTSWIVAMSEWGSVFKPEFFAPLVLGIGAFVVMFTSKQARKDKAGIAIGLGLLFIGLSFMSNAITPYKNAPIFSEAFAKLGSSPFLGILTGAVVTAVIQSSSASVGILQTLALNGVVNWGSAVYIILGQNIGTCVTAILSSLGTHKTAKRAAVIHLLFNVFGTVIFAIVVSIVFMVNKGFATMGITSFQISVFHTIFNVACTVLLFPFSHLLVKLSGIIVRDKGEEDDESEEEVTLRHLDVRILETPSFAIKNAVLEVIHMGQITLESVRKSFEAVCNNDMKKINSVHKKEKSIDKMAEAITDYLVKISNLELNEEQQEVVNKLFNMVVDIERIGDHGENIAELAEYKIEKKVEFTQSAFEEMKDIMEKVENNFNYALQSAETSNVELAKECVRIEEEVDKMEELLRSKHLDRLATGLCNPSSGVVFLDLISNLERISDHADNIAGYVIEEHNKNFRF